MAASPASSSSSSPDVCCFHCHMPSTVFKKGWGLRDGGVAMLCDKCGSAYEEETFCMTFHSTASGWRDCSSCRKPIHCGCIVSEDNYIKMDLGGVKCMECTRFDNALEEQKRVANASRIMKRPTQVNFSPATFVPCTPVPVEPPSVKPFQSTYLNLSDGIGSSSYGLNHINRLQPHPRATDFMPRNVSLSSFARVYEKLLTSRDLGLRRGCLSVPKKCAERYFPKLSRGERVTVVVEDQRCIYWEFYLSSRVKGKRLEYCLEGLGGFMSVMQCKCGDRVILHRLESSGHFVIGVEKKRN